LSSHVQKYGSILDNEYQVHVEIAEPCGDIVDPPNCDWVTTFVQRAKGKNVFSSLHIECGNTNWP